MSSSFSIAEEIPGATSIAVVAVVDLVILSMVLLHMLLTVLVRSYAGRMASYKERQLLTSPLGMYVASLFISNFISALGGAIEFEWIGSRGIDEGPICTTQGFFFQLGSNATALWLGVVSISALSTFVLRARSLRIWMAWLIIVILWTCMVVFDILASTIFAGNSKDFFYGIAGLWCWITPSHRMARLIAHYVWMWVWSLVSLVCFALVYFSVRGSVAMKKDEAGGRLKLDKSFSGSWQRRSEEYDGLAGTVGKTMAWFPVCYIMLTIPISVAQVAQTFGMDIPTYASVFAAINALLVGIVNTIIYISLRRSLKWGSCLGDPEMTLQGSYNEKLGTESFEAPQEKRPSPSDVQDPFPWAPELVQKDWLPPLPPSVNEPMPPPPMGYAVTSGEERAARLSIAPPRHVPVSNKIAQRSRSFHRPMESISTDSTHNTVVTDAGASTEALRPQLTLPLPAMLPRGMQNPSPNIISPSELQKLTYVPLTPGVQQGRGKPPGPPPPPRKQKQKQKRALTPSVPVDVDETDMGSFGVSAKPPARDSSGEDSDRMSLGDMTRKPVTESMHTFWTAYDQSQSSPKVPELPTITPSKSRDTMGTFWAAYEDSSPRTPQMPPDLPQDARLNRDTMRSFWAAYEDSSPRTPGSFKSEWKSSPTSAGFRNNESVVNLRPAISAVAKAPMPSPGIAAKDTRMPSPVPPVRDPGPSGVQAKPAAVGRALHRQSKSFPTMPAPSFNPELQSAITRYGSPGLTVRDSPSRQPTIRDNPSKHRPSPSDSSQTSATGYRPPRQQGYL